MKHFYLLIGAISLLYSCKTPGTSNPGFAYDYQVQKSVKASRAAVVTAHPLASIVGLEILKKGGNAVDAAIAVQLALAVVYPGAGNLGGGGFMVAHLQDGKNIAIDFREKAPLAATRDMYLDSLGNSVTEWSMRGALSAGVPGTVAGLFASMKYAKLPFEQLIQPAIDLAEKGFAITASEAASLNSLQEEFTQYNSKPHAFMRTTAWQKNDSLIQTDLAETLKRIRDNGAAGFYEGKTAELIVAEMQRSGGIISLEDLKNYQVAEREVVSFDYKGHQIISMPLPSSGGLIIQQCLKMLEDRNLPALGFQTAASVQLITEVERRAYADRALYMGDPDFVTVPAQHLVSSNYLVERMKDYVPARAGSSKLINAGTLPKESEETTHISIADQWGNLVAVTTTLNDSYGSKTVVGGSGFLLNDEMDDFSVKPGVPNMYGAVGAEANAIQPGKRMLSSMTPTIILKDNKPFMVVGTPGGTTIPTSVLQSIVNIIDFNLSPADAVNQPKFHHQWLPDEIFVEPDFPGTVKDSLTAMGYKVTTRSPIGRTELIHFSYKGANPEKTVIEAVADKRGDDDARGY